VLFNWLSSGFISEEYLKDITGEVDAGLFFDKLNTMDYDINEVIDIFIEKLAKYRQ